MLPKKSAKPVEKYSNMPVAQVLTEITATEKGLTSEEAQSRQLLYGKNRLKEERKLHIVLQFFANFKSPLVLILLVVAFVSLLTGGALDALIVFVMVIMSVTLNFVQEYKAGNAAAKLKEKLENVSLVIRDGEKKEVKNSDLCVGDIVEFNAGDLIPADCRVINSKDFFINQSALTGESFPVEKFGADVTIKDPELNQLTNIVFSGTSVITGSATAVIVAIGAETEFGKIAENLAEQEVEDEFTRGVNRFSIMILRIIIFFVIFIFFVNSLIKHNVLDSLLFSLAVAVGLTPELLPVIMSITMGAGSLRMAKNGVIVKKLAAIPTFGSLDILCTDKTGTLTQDKIQLIKYIDINGEYSEKVLQYAYLNSYFQTGINNPMDDAVLNFGATRPRQSAQKIDVGTYKKVDEIPFDFYRKKMSVVVEEDGKRLMITKGAPEDVLNSSKFYGLNDEKDINEINSDVLIKQYIDLSNEGYRVLALAVKKLDNEKSIYNREDENDLTLVGYIAFLDPAKKGVKEAIDSLEDAGVEVKILTGDNELVAKKICGEVGVVVKGVLLGRQLHELSDDSLKHKVNDITIFARFSPDDKNRVIRALQSNGHVVGYLGDGINDAPSLKSADVGISVSNAVDVAKESADIVLTQKSLSQLKDGVIEGRKTFGNTMKYLMMGISSNFGNMFSVLGAVLFLPFLPMLPIQILLNNFLYDISQITIPLDNVDPEFIQKPKRWDIGFIKKFMFIFGPISSLFDFITFFAMYMFFKNSAGSFQTAWFMESLATQTLVIHIIRTRSIPFFKSRPSKYLVLTTLLAVGVGWLIPFTVLGGYFEFKALPLQPILVLLAIIILYLFSVDMGKKIFYEKFGKI